MGDLPIKQLAAVVLASVSAHPAMAARPGGSCVAALRQAIARDEPNVVGETCWRVGPIRLGMSAAEVEQRLGAPVAATAAVATNLGRPRRYSATLYAFPALPGALVHAGRARMRLVELLYEGDRLVAIDNGPSARVDSDPCPAAAHPPAQELKLSAPAGPMLSFAGVHVGSRLVSLKRRFGRTPSGNRSKDWYNYLPVPISFGVGPALKVITGFTIATDFQALTTSAWAKLHVKRYPATCKMESIEFRLGDD